MNTDKIREYVMVKDEFNHPILEETGCYEWNGDLSYTDEIHRMLNEVFRMNKLSTEMSYVVAFDHAKKSRGVCRIGQGDLNSVPTSMQNIFTFLLLTGAYSFILVHNHVSDLPEASVEDKMISIRASNLSNMFDMEFIGHMIINPSGYIIDGGTMNGTVDEIEYEDLGNGMAATYVFGNRIEGKLEDITKICES